MSTGALENEVWLHNLVGLLSSQKCSSIYWSFLNCLSPDCLPGQPVLSGPFPLRLEGFLLTKQAWIYLHGKLTKCCCRWRIFLNQLPLAAKYKVIQNSRERPAISELPCLPESVKIWWLMLWGRVNTCPFTASKKGREHWTISNHSFWSILNELNQLFNHKPTILLHLLWH